LLFPQRAPFRSGSARLGRSQKDGLPFPPRGEGLVGSRPSTRANCLTLTPPRPATGCALSGLFGSAMLLHVRERKSKFFIRDGCEVERKWKKGRVESKVKRNWACVLAASRLGEKAWDDPQHVFPGQGQMTPEQLDSASAVGYFGRSSGCT
jgi:hypothetical protein